MWIIDFCEDNFKHVDGAAQAATRLQERLRCDLAERDPFPVRFLMQRCIGACRICHRASLVLRLNDELISGETHDEVISHVYQKIMGMDA